MAFPSDLVRTKNWGNEILTDADLEGQLDLIIDWTMGSLDDTTGHKHDATSNEGPKIAVLAASVAGNTNFTGTISFDTDPTFDGAFIPSGGIIIWSGAISAIPSGWVICDGNNSTPNLTDKFVLHADADSSGTRDVGDTGGSNASSHVHTIPSSGWGPDTGAHSSDDLGLGASTGGNDSARRVGTHPDTGAALATADDNLPPFYALAYIMKT